MTFDIYTRYHYSHLMKEWGRIPTYEEWFDTVVMPYTATQCPSEETCIIGERFIERTVDEE